jgi:hypothetical protein
MLEMNRWTLGCSLESVLHTDYWGGGGAESEADSA